MFIRTADQTILKTDQDGDLDPALLPLLHLQAFGQITIPTTLVIALEALALPVDQDSLVEWLLEECSVTYLDQEEVELGVIEDDMMTIMTRTGTLHQHLAFLLALVQLPPQALAQQQEDSSLK